MSGGSYVQSCRPANLRQFGFRFGRGGTHARRTMMLKELSTLLVQGHRNKSGKGRCYVRGGILMGAGVLRNKPNIRWGKDRGKDVPSTPWYHVFTGDRVNDYHLALKEKHEARRQVSQEGSA